ncbi:MAG: hypothetical protein AAB493_01660 [Patescibacteria group bacterium]
MDEDEEIKEEEDFTCSICGMRQYSNICQNCGIEIKEENEKEKNKDDEDEYDWRERR